MASSKVSYSVPMSHTRTPGSKTVPGFVWKSVGAALCGAAIPAVVFYFLF